MTEPAQPSTYYLTRCRVCEKGVDVVVRTPRGTQCVECAAILIDAQWDRIRLLTWWLAIAVILAAGLVVAQCIRGG